MRIEMDAVVNEYVLEAVEALLESNMASCAREKAVMAALKTLMDSGLTKHHYNAARGIDEFRATDDLTWQWERDFPGIEDVVDPTETIIVEVGNDGGTFSEKLRG